MWVLLLLMTTCSLTLSEGDFLSILSEIERNYLYVGLSALIGLDGLTFVLQT